ncbi:methyltransferase domain-containing protein [Acidobacteriia bacterium AH_259_A11_L15]|nr:methyltransferase domain-containing protein [Acidobacteriia bacterium AH_259_A11_L15]
MNSPTSGSPYPFPQQCPDGVRYENSYRNFPDPADLVEDALKLGIIGNKMKVLEVGAGCLRNSRYLEKEFRKRGWTSKIEVADISQGYAAFESDYKKFSGKVYKDSFPKIGYDIVFSTFVVESICPRRNRHYLLSCIYRALKPGGKFLVSFRGPAIVKKAKTRTRCHEGEGFWTAGKTYLRSYNIQEAKALLRRAGFKDKNIKPMRKYRTPEPEYVDIIACK